MRNQAAWICFIYAFFSLLRIQNANCLSQFLLVQAKFRVAESNKFSFPLWASCCWYFSNIHSSTPKISKALTIYSVVSSLRWAFFIFMAALFSFNDSLLLCDYGISSTRHVYNATKWCHHILHLNLHNMKIFYFYASIKFGL